MPSYLAELLLRDCSEDSDSPEAPPPSARHSQSQSLHVIGDQSFSSLGSDIEICPSSGA